MTTDKKMLDAVANTVGVCANFTDVRSAAKFLSPYLVIRATHHGRPDKRDKRIDLVVKIGRPNFAERKFIRRCQKAGEPFPVKKIQLKFWPQKGKRR